MTLRIADRWLWDFWTVTVGDDVHAFYLQAPRSLGDADLRHWNVTIGHARSRDLVRWEVLPPVTAPMGSDRWRCRSSWRPGGASTSCSRRTRARGRMPSGCWAPARTA